MAMIPGSESALSNCSAADQAVAPSSPAHRQTGWRGRRLGRPVRPAPTAPPRRHPEPHSHTRRRLCSGRRQGVTLDCAKEQRGGCCSGVLRLRRAARQRAAAADRPSCRTPPPPAAISSDAAAAPIDRSLTKVHIWSGSGGCAALRERVQLGGCGSCGRCLRQHGPGPHGRQMGMSRGPAGGRGGICWARAPLAAAAGHQAPGALQARVQHCALARHTDQPCWRPKCSDSRRSRDGLRAECAGSGRAATHWRRRRPAQGAGCPQPRRP